MRRPLALGHNSAVGLYGTQHQLHAKQLHATWLPVPSREPVLSLNSASCQQRNVIDLSPFQEIYADMLL